MKCTHTSVRRRKQSLYVAVGTLGLASALHAATTYPVALPFDFRLEVNTTTGDVGLLNLATSSSALTQYAVEDVSTKDLLIGNPADGNGTSAAVETGVPPYTNELFLSAGSGDPNAVMPIPGRSGNNSSYWRILADTPGNQQGQGGLLSEWLGNTLNRAINVPGEYEIDLGDIYNTTVASPDLIFQWGTQSNGGSSLGNFYSSGLIDYTSGSPSPAVQYFFFKNSVSTGNLSGVGNWSSTSVIGTDNEGAPLGTSNQYVCIQNSDAVSHVVTLDQNAAGLLDLRIGNSDSAAGGSDTLLQNTNVNITTSAAEIVGEAGAGAHYQSAGTNNVGVIYVGDQAGSVGTYSLSGTGSVSAGGLVVAQAGSGTFTQSGGIAHFTASRLIVQNYNGTSNQNYATFPGAIFVSATWSGTLQGAGTGAYLLSGGSLTVQGSVYVGQGGAFSVSGGSMSASGEINIAGGNYSQSAGSVSGAVSVGSGSTMTLAGGTLSSANVYGSRVTIGSSNPINVAGGFGLNSTSTTFAQLEGSTHSFADVQVSGVLTLAGSLSLYEDAANEAMSNSSQTFILFDTTNGGVLSGSFANISTGHMLTTTDGTASYLVTIVPGVDGFVELSDYTPVPEPGTAGVIGLAGMAAMLRRRRRNPREAGG